MTEARLCVLCPVRGRRPDHYERAQACEQCRVWLAGVLRDIADTYPDLADQLHPRKGGGQRVAGSREAPVPLVLDVVDLTHGGHRGYATADGRLWAEDQIGHMAIRARLGSWAQDWLSYDWCRSDRLPEHTTAYALAAWLGKWADDACSHHPAVDEFADEMVEVLATIRAYVPRMVEEDEQPPKQRPEPRTAPCPACDMTSLWWFPSEERVRCDTDGCNRVMTDDEYARWARLVIADERTRA